MEIIGIRVVAKYDEDPDYSYLEMEENQPEGAERLKGLYAGEWCYLGLWAEGEVIVNGVVQLLRSGGLWGIESDSDKEYVEEIARDELEQLKQVMVELGFAEEEVKEAIGRARYSGMHFWA